MIGIVGVMRQHGQKTILITRLSPESAAEIAAVYPLDYRAEARCGIIGDLPEPDGIGRIVIATGGTSDIPVAEEAALTAEVHGNEVLRLYDVGVAGLHRTLHHMDDIMSASVIIAIAGMEGALGQRHRRSGGLPGDRRAHQRGLRRVLRRRVGSAVHAELLRQRRVAW